MYSITVQPSLGPFNAHSAAVKNFIDTGAGVVDEDYPGPRKFFVQSLCCQFSLCLHEANGAAYSRQAPTFGKIPRSAG